MPITFPAHAAAVFALGRPARTKLPGTALLVGTAVPDFAFALKGTAGIVSHRLDALFWYALPLGMLVYLSLEALVLPALRLATPGFKRFQPVHVFESRGPPDSVSTWLAAIAAVLVGALTHLFLDSLTHDGRLLAEALYPGGAVDFLGKTMSYPTLAHRVTSWGGTAIVAVWFLARSFGDGRKPNDRCTRLFPFLVLSAATTYLGVGGWRSSSAWAATHLSHVWPLVAGGWIGLCASAAVVLTLSTCRPFSARSSATTAPRGSRPPSRSSASPVPAEGAG